LEKLASPGEHKIQLKQKEGSSASYAIEVSYYDPSLPSHNNGCSVRFSYLSLRSSKLNEGESTEIVIKLKNTESEELPMTMAIIGIPAGLEIRHEKLQELKQANIISSYELFGARKLACYFRGMKPDEEISFEIDVIATFPGSYTGPSSCTYLYYTNELRHWLEGFHVEISP